MDFLKELFASGEDLQVNYLMGAASNSGALHHHPDNVNPSCSTAAKDKVQDHPLPLLPADIPTQLTVNNNRHTRCTSLSTVEVASLPSDSSQNRDHGNFDSLVCNTEERSPTERDPVDIQEVPSEMPIYLLAEDEGNEEEILRLLESESPGGSPYLPLSSPVSLTEPQGVNCTTELKNQYSVNSSSLNQEVAISKDKNIGDHFKKENLQRSKGKRRGGWPRGKSRKPPDLLPKPPATGYSFYISENRIFVEKECGTKSTPVLSKRLGKMWSELTTEQKNVYNGRAKLDRLRYLKELDQYITLNYKGVNLERAQNYVSQSLSGEKDDNNLACYVCDLNFASLYSKQSHYSGKLHLQTLLQNIENLTEPNTESYNSVADNGLDARTAIESVTVDYCGSLEKRSFLVAKIYSDLEVNADYQQQYQETEYYRIKYTEMLRSLQIKEMLLRKGIQNLLHII